jgi:hypothetical protein
MLSNQLSGSGLADLYYLDRLSACAHLKRPVRIVNRPVQIVSICYRWPVESSLAFPCSSSGRPDVLPVTVQKHIRLGRALT